MRIYINDYPVEFTVENENSLSDVVKSISEWAAGRELVFSEAMIDGTLYSVEDIPDYDISEVNEINCSVRSVSEIVISSIEEGIAYCGKVTGRIETLPEGKTLEAAELADLLAGASWLLEMTQKVFTLAGMDVEARYRDTSIADLLDEISSLLKSVGSEGITGETAGRLSGLFSSLKEVYSLALQSDEMNELSSRSIDSPETLISELLAMKERSLEMAELIEEVVTLFQTGKDREAMTLLDSVIEFIYDYNRICYQAVPVFGVDLEEIVSDNLSMDQVNGALLEQLNALLEVMENGDIISLSDLLEYEIKPLFENISTMTGELLAVISGDSAQ